MAIGRGLVTDNTLLVPGSPTASQGSSMGFIINTTPIGGGIFQSKYPVSLSPVGWRFRKAETIFYPLIQFPPRCFAAQSLICVHILFTGRWGVSLSVSESTRLSRQPTNQNVINNIKLSRRFDNASRIYELPLCR